MKKLDQIIGKISQNKNRIVIWISLWNLRNLSDWTLFFWKILFEDFLIESMISDAVVRNIEIIGEASKNMPEEIKKKCPGIPWLKISGIRNRIVHDYFGVDLEIIWYIAANELAPLKAALKICLKK